MGHAWDKCVNLQELCMNARKIEDLKNVFSSPKEHLKVLKIEHDDDSNAEDVKKVRDVCAKGTKCVEELEYFGPPLTRDISKTFFGANRTSLSSVIACTREYHVGKILDELLDSLLKLPGLEELVLK